MNTVLNVLLVVLFLFVALWVLIFGGIGALLARLRGDAPLKGFLWGTCAGPVGWIVVLWQTRHTARSGGGSGASLGDEEAAGPEDFAAGTGAMDSDSSRHGQEGLRF